MNRKGVANIAIIVAIILIIIAGFYFFGGNITGKVTNPTACADLPHHYDSGGKHATCKNSVEGDCCVEGVCSTCG